MSHPETYSEMTLVVTKGKPFCGSVISLHPVFRCMHQFLLRREVSTEHFLSSAAKRTTATHVTTAGV